MWNTITIHWLLFVGTIGTLERAHMARMAEAAVKIQVGSTEDEVVRILGKTLSTYERYDGWTFLGIGAHPPQWLYGTSINIKKMFISDNYVMASPLPINIRWFSYEDEDLIVEWDANERMTSHISAELRRIVLERSGNRCEYCLIHSDDTIYGCQVDHVVAEKHFGKTVADNLAMACVFCNRFKERLRKSDSFQSLP